MASGAKNLKEKISNLFFPEHFGQLERFGFPTMIFIAVYGFFLSVMNPEYFRDIYTMKYGFLCYLQTLFIFIMLLISLYRGYHFLRLGDYLKVFIALCFVALFVFGVGEKLRWGQFIFSLDVPDFFRQHNAQGQITIHNLRFGDFSVNKVIFGTGLGILIAIYCIIMPWAYDRFQGFKAFINRLGLPMASWPQVLWYLIGAIIALNIPASRRGEVLELVGCFSIAMIWAFPKNRHLFDFSRK